MVKHTYTMGEAAAALGISERTLGKWFDKAERALNINVETYRRSLIDGRRYDIPIEVLQKVAALFGHELRADLPPIRSHHGLSQRKLMEAENARLRADLEATRAALANIRAQIATPKPAERTYTPNLGNNVARTVTQRTKPSESTPAPSGRVRNRGNRRTTSTPDMPDHLMGLNQLCEGHGVSATTARKEWHDMGVFQVEGPYKIGRAAQAWAIDRENALRALRYWQAHEVLDEATLGHCGVELCPCPELVTTEEV